MLINSYLFLMSEFTTYPKSNSNYALQIYNMNMDYLKKESDSSNSSFEKINIKDSRNYENTPNYNKIKIETEYQFRRKDVEDNHKLESKKCLQEYELQLKNLTYNIKEIKMNLKLNLEFFKKL